MEVILNIGLNTNTGLAITPINALCALHDAGLRVTEYSFRRSDTELTLVAVAQDDAPGLDNRLYELARHLHQDCVGVWYSEEQYGDLIGPNAAAWGAFNPEFFILPTGERLAAQQARANRQAQFGAWAAQRQEAA